MLSNSTSSESIRVLLVDDNEAMLARAAGTLSSSCVVVGSAKDGPSALEAARALQPDIIVLDISMPGMTGLEVAAKLRETGSKAAVVFLTVHNDKELVLAARSVGAIGYVIKARLGSDLVRAVRDAHAGRSFVSLIS